MPRERVLNEGAYGYCIHSAERSHIKLYPHWMTVSLEHLYAKAVQISESIDWESEVRIYADGFLAGTLRGQI